MASDSQDKAIDAHSRSALASTKTNLRYLYDPKTAHGVNSRRTRALLRVLRSSVIFIFWRVVRYAKYVAIGSLVATIGAGVFGTFVSGAGFVLAPTGILGTVVAGTTWGIGRLAVRRLRGRWDRGHGYGDAEQQRDERLTQRGPEAMPW
ncbi:uncharacterized protein K460DRAFT_275570 [Cucurbitaria berberidis CBS 394.84]|uniref:Uncharacterized protein n=1 Tax=Cucurbitaria berberidis CBS 394.84 TaxID=1168544 RepID=A0A9P4GJF4_9PLEO|nr:uncharacterized protein K460DRAFT_275570 [Cucurbitaria berberidis CBS 394.84]KAF1847353.1 hypothetical protein K460DRAFT_275570 [Cucurbitaria berberidis CBS 394.84]